MDCRHADCMLNKWEQPFKLKLLYLYREGVLRGNLGGRVPPRVLNPRPISDQNMSFSTPVFSPDHWQIMSSLLSLQRQQKTFLNSISNLYITLSFLFIWNWNNKYVYTLLWFPRKPHQIADENEQSWYPFSDWNGTKTIHTLWGGTYPI